MKNKLRMHIVLIAGLTPGQAAVACAHAGLGTYLYFRDNPLVEEWLNTSFSKIIYQASPAMFEVCKTLGDHRAFTESTLDNKQVALGFDITVSSQNDRFKALSLYPL